MDARFYTEDVRLPDGGLVHIRAIRPDDKERLLEGFHRLSERSVYYRFFSLKKDLSATELEYLTEVDFVQHVALAAIVRPPSPASLSEFGFGEFGEIGGGEDAAGAASEAEGEEIIGVGRYVVQGEGRAEVAIAVADAYQHRGIGSVLIQHLAIIARAAGLTTFEANVLAQNQPLHQAFLTRCGFRPTFTPAGETVHLSFSILSRSKIASAGPQSRGSDADRGPL